MGPPSAQQQQGARPLEGLTPRDREVLELMARGLSNAAICDKLHLSIKTVELLVGAIFSKLRLHPDADSNHRVLAVLAYLRNRGGTDRGRSRLSAVAQLMPSF